MTIKQMKWNSLLAGWKAYQNGEKSYKERINRKVNTFPKSIAYNTAVKSTAAKIAAISVKARLNRDPSLIGTKAVFA